VPSTPPTNGRPGWRDVLSAVEASETRVLREVRRNADKIDRLERHVQEHPVPKNPVEKECVDDLDIRVDTIEGRFDNIEGQMTVLRVVSSTIGAVVAVGLTVIGLYIAAGF
jgi:hypothetical protein